VTVELHWWPCARPILPLELFRLNSVGEAMLKARLPQPLPTALATAELLLDWVSGKWQAGQASYTLDGDANRILDRTTTGGARYGAVEYTIVLTQALNALRIPARRLRGLAEGYHERAGLAAGPGHPMTEAWIDDLASWVVFDGRNGATWRDQDGAPLGALELQRLYRTRQRPQFKGAGPNFRAAEAVDWFTFFHTVAVSDGLAWSSGPYNPVTGTGTVLRASRLADSDVDAAPDLAAISTSVTADRNRPALVFRTDHPYATGFAVAESTVADEKTQTTLSLDQPFPLDAEPGEHRLTVATMTPYGALTQHHLHYHSS